MYSHTKYWKRRITSRIGERCAVEKHKDFFGCDFVAIQISYWLASTLNEYNDAVAMAGQNQTLIRFEFDSVSVCSVTLYRMCCFEWGRKSTGGTSTGEMDVCTWLKVKRRRRQMRRHTHKCRAWHVRLSHSAISSCDCIVFETRQKILYTDFNMRETFKFKRKKWNYFLQNNINSQNVIKIHIRDSFEDSIVHIYEYNKMRQSRIS